MVDNGNGRLTRPRNDTYRQSLQNKTRKQLAQLARRQQIPGWHPMRKAKLIDALVDAAGRTNGSSRKTVGTKTPGPAHAEVNGVAGNRDDVLIPEPVSSRWLSARWNVSPEMLTRADRGPSLEPSGEGRAVKLSPPNNTSCPTSDRRLGSGRRVASATRQAFANPGTILLTLQA